MYFIIYLINKDETSLLPLKKKKKKKKKSIVYFHQKEGGRNADIDFRL